MNRSVDNPGATMGPGSPTRLDDAVQMVYQELQRLARRQLNRERAHHTLQATALVHEAYGRLAKNPALAWDNQNHFLGLAAGVMRQVLVDHARRRNADKRGGDQQRVTLIESGVPEGEVGVDVLDLHRAIEKLNELDAQMARMVELRFFGGLNLEETMEVLGQSRRKIDKDWAFAKLWLARELDTGT